MAELHRDQPQDLQHPSGGTDPLLLTMQRTALPPRRTPIRKVSSKRSKELREYSKKRKAFLLDHPFCQVWLARNDITEMGDWFYRDSKSGQIYSDLTLLALRPDHACDIHHKAGRTGWRLNDETQWLAVSREAHEWIHANPSEARRRGWLV